MSGWEGDFCAEGRDALGCAEFLERQYVRKSIVSARLRARLLYGRLSGAMACVWMRGILGEAVCEGEQNKCRAEREIVARKTKGKQCLALRSAESLVRQ